MCVPCQVVKCILLYSLYFSFSLTVNLKILISELAFIGLKLNFLKLTFLQAEVLNYSGDLNTPPDQAERKKKTNFVGKKLKGKGKRNDDDDSSDENDW